MDDGSFCTRTCDAHTWRSSPRTSGRVACRLEYRRWPKDDQAKSLFNSSLRASLPARLAAAVVSKWTDECLMGLTFPIARIEIPQRSSLLLRCAILSVRSTEALGSETARVHHAHRRRGGVAEEALRWVNTLRFLPRSGACRSLSVQQRLSGKPSGFARSGIAGTHSPMRSHYGFASRDSCDH